MPIDMQLAIARARLAEGDERAYVAQILAGIRGAMTGRSVDAFRRAIAEDGTAHLFSGLETSRPIAA